MADLIQKKDIVDISFNLSSRYINDVYYSTNAMTFRSVLSTFLSFVTTSLQHPNMEFSYHKSYVMQKLAVHTIDYVYRARLGIGLHCYKIEFPL